MSKNKFILWGSAGHAKVLADLIHLLNGEIVALFDNDVNKKTSLVEVPLYYGLDGFKQWLKVNSKTHFLQAAVAIGGSRGKDRQLLAEVFRSAEISLPSIVHPTAVVASSVIVGEGTQILANSVVAADATLGELCIINNSVNVDHECIIGDGVHLAPGAVLCGCVTVGENSMVGAGAVVMPRIRIGQSAVVGAGSVVTSDIPDYATVVGNPAKILKVRDD